MSECKCAIPLRDCIDSLGCRMVARLREARESDGEIERLRAELAASRHELDGAKKAANAQARIIESLQQQRAHLHAQRDQWVEACDTLDSERAANARLTEELAACREREARMRKLLQAANVLFAHHCRDCTASNWLDDTRAALAEGAQG